MAMKTQRKFLEEPRILQTFSRRVTPGAGGLILFVCLAWMLLSGCSARSLRADYKGYEDAYAKSSNRQMLLNLARLNQHHPTYFFKIGQISTSYRMQANITGNGTFAPTGNPNGVTGGGSPTLLYEKDPVFTFIPVNDDAMSKQLVQPVPATLFYILYQQGWRVDQLFRLMVDHLELRMGKGTEPRMGSGTELKLIRNHPSRDNIDDYITFLRVSDIAYELQKRGLLLLKGESRFVPVAKGFEQTAAPSAKDIWDAKDKGAVWRKTDKGAWELAQETILPVFLLNLPAGNEKDTEQALLRIQDTIAAAVPELKIGESLHTTLEILKNGFTIQENYPPADTAGIDQPGAAHLVMRSLIGLMAAAAQEQEPFEELMTGPEFSQRFGEQVPKDEQQPLIQLTWKSKDPLAPVLVQLDYLGTKYAVADVKSCVPPKVCDALDPVSWNRDVFRLVSQLAAQMTVDISKFPLPEILQLRTQ
jgi:hypothetical protein